MKNWYNHTLNDCYIYMNTNIYISVLLSNVIIEDFSLSLSLSLSLPLSLPLRSDFIIISLSLIRGYYEIVVYIFHYCIYYIIELLILITHATWLLDQLSRDWTQWDAHHYVGIWIWNNTKYVINASGVAECCKTSITSSITPTW